MPYCFPRSSIKFQGHTGQNITDFDPNWAFPDYKPVAAFKSLRFALLKFCHYFDLVKLVKFGVSGHFPENAWREWSEILHAAVSPPPSELIRLWSRSSDIF